jgi:hypothetical protein
MKIERCEQCNKDRHNNSPISYVWWWIMGVGHMCWHCYDRHKRSKA